MLFTHSCIICTKIGVDLRNELRASTIDGQTVYPAWGDDSQPDWARAATLAGNNILAINKDLLIIVEGLDYALDLRKVKDYPITLDTSNKLVYSAHDYSW